MNNRDIYLAHATSCHGVSNLICLIKEKHHHCGPIEIIHFQILTPHKLEAETRCSNTKLKLLENVRIQNK